MGNNFSQSHDTSPLGAPSGAPPLPKRPIPSELLSIPISYVEKYIRELSVLPSNCPFRYFIGKAWSIRANPFFRPFVNYEHILNEFTAFAELVLSSKSDKELERQYFSFFENLEVKVFSSDRPVLSIQETTSSVRTFPYYNREEEEESSSLIDLILMRATVPAPVRGGSRERFLVEDRESLFYYCFRECKEKCRPFLENLVYSDCYETEKFRLVNKEINKNSELWHFSNLLYGIITYEIPTFGRNTTAYKLYSAIKRQVRIKHCGQTGHMVATYLDSEMKSLTYSPHRCHSVICPICEFEASRKSLKEVSEIFVELSANRHIAFWTLTTKAERNISVALDRLFYGLNRLRMFKISKETVKYFNELFERGLKKYEEELKKQYKKGKISQSKMKKKIRLQRFFHSLFIERVEKLLSAQKKIRFYQLGRFVVKMETNVKPKGYNLHAHIMTDVIISKVFLSEFASEVLGLGYIVDVRSVKGAKAVKEIAKYITKTSQFRNLCAFSKVIFESVLFGRRRLRKWNIEKIPKEEEDKEGIKVKFVSTAVCVDSTDYREEYRRSFETGKCMPLANIYDYQVENTQQKRFHFRELPEELQKVGNFYTYKGEYFAILDSQYLEHIETQQLATLLMRISFSLINDFSPFEYKVFLKFVKRFFKEKGVRGIGRISRLIYDSKRMLLELLESRAEEEEEETKGAGKKIIEEFVSYVKDLSDENRREMLVKATIYANAIMNFKFIEPKYEQECSDLQENKQYSAKFSSIESEIHCPDCDFEVDEFIEQFSDFEDGDIQEETPLSDNEGAPPTDDDELLGLIEF